MIRQKYIKVKRGSYQWLLGPDGVSGYLADQSIGNSGIEKDFGDGWVIKFCWEDQNYVVLILEWQQ